MKIKIQPYYILTTSKNVTASAVANSFWKKKRWYMARVHLWAHRAFVFKNDIKTLHVFFPKKGSKIEKQNRPLEDR